MEDNDSADIMRDVGAEAGIRTAVEMQESLGPFAADAAVGMIEALVVSIALWTSPEDAFFRIREAARAVQLLDKYPSAVSAEQARDFGRGLACDVLGDLPEPLARRLASTAEGFAIGAISSLAALTTPDRAAVIVEAVMRAIRDDAARTKDDSRH